MLQDEKWFKLAILYDKHAKYSPSNLLAIDRFCESAYLLHVKPIIIGASNVDGISAYNGLFIRDTTHPKHYTYQLSMAAENFGLKVLDSTYAIDKGCNKIWQIERFREHNIQHPKSTFTTWMNYGHFDNNIDYPVVIKIPDSCFSQGVYLVKNKEEFIETIVKIFKKGTIYDYSLIVQEFIKTDFDWRIGILDKKIIFACKYYMVDHDWKIIKYDRNGNYIEGHHEAVSIDSIPSKVTDIAYQCMKFLDEGLYGIDIKETKEKCYAIEINDNPSIDGGVEDKIEGSKIYEAILKWFKKGFKAV
jgi:glutathione synthase/RimK-type ligase-like ATP-grasp enzyme